MPHDRLVSAPRHYRGESRDERVGVYQLATELLAHAPDVPGQYPQSHTARDGLQQPARSLRPEGRDCVHRHREVLQISRQRPDGDRRHRLEAPPVQLRDQRQQAALRTADLTDVIDIQHAPGRGGHQPSSPPPSPSTAYRPHNHSRVVSITSSSHASE